MAGAKLEEDEEVENGWAVEGFVEMTEAERKFVTFRRV